MTSLGPDGVDGLLGQMTVDEKVAQLGASWFTRLVGPDGQLSPEAMGRRLGEGIGHVTRIATECGLGPADTSAYANGIQRFLLEQTRLGIPALIHEEAVAGLCGRDATQFPQAIGLASTWDPALVEEVAGAIRGHLLAVGARQALAPVLDIARDPRWGRLEETYGEDPYLSSRMGVAFVRGLQSDDLRTGVAATAKHFLGYGFAEGGLNHAPAAVGPRLLRDVVAAPFRAAIAEAGLASVMAAYNEVDGLACHGSPELLEDLLRGELGFDGVVVADYFGIGLLESFHAVAADVEGCAVLALGAGVDIELPATRAYRRIPGLIEEGRLDAALLDRSVARVLELKERLGLFEDPFVPGGPDATAAFDTPAHRALARRAATGSIVLLTNDGTLPLAPERLARVAVIGPTAADGRLSLGDYNYPAHVEIASEPLFGAPASQDQPFDPEHVAVPIVTVLDGVRAVLPDDVEVVHEPGSAISGDDVSGFDAAVAAAAGASVALVCVGGRSGLTRASTSGEFRDVTSLGLPGVQEQLVEAVVATGTPTVVIVLSGRVHALPAMADRVAALVCAWLPGEEGGRAVADVLVGAQEPSGRLPVTVPRHVGQVPTHHDHHKGAGRSQFLGDYVDSPVAPLFPFGHGLGFTTFTYGSLDVEVGADGGLDVGCTITNTGDRAGTEVVQLYLRDEVASVGRPGRALAGFARVDLAPGRSARVRFGVDPGRLGFHDAAVAFVVEPGDATVLVGASAADIRLSQTVAVGGARRHLDPGAVLPTSVQVDVLTHQEQAVR